MAQDISKTKDVVINVDDDDGPEEGEIEDDSSEEESCTRNSTGNFFKGKSYNNAKDVFFSEGKIKHTSTLAEDLSVRIGYPACVEEVYKKERPWVEKADTLDNRSSHQARKATDGADYQVEKENKAKYHGHSKISRRLRSSGSPSTPIHDSSKSRVYTRSETLRSPVVGRRKSTRISKAQEKEKYKKRRHDSEERRKCSKNSLKGNLLGKKLGLHDESSDIEVQIQKTKQRFQNKECNVILNTPLVEKDIPTSQVATLTPETFTSTPEIVTLSSSDNQELNKSSSSIEILDVTSPQSQPEVPHPNTTTSEISTPINVTDISNVTETKVDDSKEILNLRLEALKSAIQAKYGGKGKALKNKQSGAEQQKCEEKKPQPEVVDIDVEPVDMDLSVTDDEKEESSNKSISEIPVIVNSNVMEQTSNVMFYPNWHDPSNEIPMHPHIANGHIPLDKITGPSVDQFYETDTNTCGAHSPRQTQNLVTINPIEHTPAPLVQLPCTEQKHSNETELAKKNSEVEDEDEELLRAQLLIAISSKQNSVPPPSTADSLNVPPVVTETKSSTLSPKTTLLNQVNASKAGSKLILKEIFKSKKAQKLRKARSFKATSKDITVKGVQPTTRTLPAPKSVKKTVTGVQSAEVKSTTQTTPSVGRIVINLGEDSDSEEESDTAKKIETPEKTVKKPPETVQSTLALNLDQFLKQVRHDVEQKQQPKIKSVKGLMQSKQIAEEEAKDLDIDNPACSSNKSYPLLKSSEHKVGKLNSPPLADTGTSVKETSVESNQIKNLPSKTNSPTLKKVSNSTPILNVSNKETAIKETRVDKDNVKLNRVTITPPKSNKKIAIKAPVTASTKNVISTKKLTPKTPTQLKSTGQSKVMTPSAVSHLPSSQQMEYRRLKLEIARREELRKLKIKLGQAVTRSPSEISMQDPPKLEITVNNYSCVESDNASSRVVRQALSSEDMNDTTSLNRKLDTSFVIVNKESELSEEQELKHSTFENKNNTENDKEMPCIVEIQAEKIAVSNDNSDIALSDPQSKVNSRVSETEAQKLKEEKSTGSFKRKSLGYETPSKRVKSNKNVEDLEEPSPVFIVTDNSPGVKPVFKCQNLNQLPTLSISLSESGRSVAELAIQTKDEPLQPESSVEALLRDTQIKNTLLDNMEIDDGAVQKNKTLKKVKTSKEHNSKNKISKTRKHQERRSTVSKERDKKTLVKSEMDLLKNREELLEQLKRLEKLLGTVKHGQDQVTDAEARVEALKRELTRAEIRAEEERTAVRKLFNQVGQVRVEVAQARTRCAGIFKTCQRLGHEMMGKSYRVPQDRAEELKIHLQQVVDLTQKTKKSKQISHPSTPVPSSNPSTPISINLAESETLQCQNPDVSPSVISNDSSNLTQTENSKANLSHSAENSCDLSMSNKYLKTTPFCIDVLPNTCCTDLKISKNNSEPEMPVPFKSNLLLCETLPVTSNSNNAGVAPILKPYKSPLEHMKLRNGMQEEGGDADRNMDPNRVMCPYELTGRCNDDGCKYLHPCSSKQ